MKLLALFLTLAAAFAAEPAKLPASELLRYSVNWPSGLSLGELAWTTNRAASQDAQNASEVTIEAGVAMFPVRDVIRSLSDGNLCSVQLDKQVQHGKKASEETTTFNRKDGKALRQTKGGGKTELSTSPCPRDALAYLHHLRLELAAGRIPPAQTVYLGAAYAVKLEYGGQQTVEVNGQRRDADRLVGNLKGPASDLKFELFFARDAVRTLLAARVPITLGTLSLELVP